MRIIDADSLMDDIKRDSKKAIDEGDKVGSFWLGYAAGLVIKQPTIQPEKAQLSKGGATSDLISRQAARHALCKAVHNGEDIPCENQTASCLWTGTRVCDFVREIDALPPAQPEPHEGHWILYDKRFPWRTWYKCSECGNYLDFAGVNGGRAEPHFCPNCGAKMTISTK